MIITESTTYEEAAAFIELMSEDQKAILNQRAVELFGDPWGMKIGEILGMIEKQADSFPFNIHSADITLLQYLWMQQLDDFFNRLSKILERFKVAETQEQKQASQGSLKMSFREGVLVFLRSYFGLHTFDEALELPLADFLLAKKDEYNKTIFNINYARISARKSKTK